MRTVDIMVRRLYLKEYSNIKYNETLRMLAYNLYTKHRAYSTSKCRKTYYSCKGALYHAQCESRTTLFLFSSLEDAAKISLAE